MTALVKDVNRCEKVGRIQAFAVKGAVNIFHNALVKVGADGFLAPQAAEAGAAHAGVAYEACDNSNGADGEALCRVEMGQAFEMEGLAFVQADILKPVYASDDNTVSVTQGADEMVVGKIIEIISATKVLVLQNRHESK